MGVLESVHRDIADRLAELQPVIDEYRLLEQAVTLLDEPLPLRQAEPRRSQARRGTTKARILAYLDAHPGSTAGDVANALRLNRNSVGTRLAQLARAGEIKKAARGYQL